MIGSRMSLTDARVLDLFAGSGALGIEALSRGAAHVTFVENDVRAIEAIRENLAALGFSEAAEVVSAEVVTWCRGQAAQLHYDVVFADPPYAFDGWRGLAELVDADLLVAESDRAAELGEGWGLLTERRYGGTVVVLASPSRKVRS